MNIWIALGVVVVVGVAAALRRSKWDNANARDRYLRGEMSDEEKRFRGFYPYHNGPFA